MCLIHPGLVRVPLSLFYSFDFQEFVELAKELKESPSLRNHITTNAKKHVCEHHSVENERNTYKWLVEKLVSHQYRLTAVGFENSNKRQGEKL